jgi:hypothetical protein
MIFRVQGHRTLQRLQADGMVENDEEWLRIRTQPNLQYKLWRSDGSSEWGEISDAYGKQAKIARVAEPEE